MQIDRMLQIIYILLNRKTITASELAERFEVSQRTIYRDIDALCQAGIPVYTSKGKNGGISILDNFVLNKSIFSKGEQNEMIAALQSLSAINYPEADRILSKLSNIFDSKSNDWIEIDFSGWGNLKQEMLASIKSAVINKKVISFEYYNAYREKNIRTVEPLQLLFKGKAWYLKAFCRVKRSMRLFKLSRIKNIQILDEHFDRQLESEALAAFDIGTDINIVDIIMKIHSSQAYRVYDEFDDAQISLNDDGSFTICVSYPEDEWVYGYILSFGMYAEVIEPARIKKIIKEQLEKALDFYK
ncbi:helix-turn-helix transcriptional regulator [Lutispora saccharofermentans]|uniref:YafY family transcriptional regulator n=1 Tax=Lutispora saccharofermentans TaxID=3024236 RepID=A0ABT1NGQ3_9FIRM|nr:YafY family protein [Lutispora saccharofermentans]MCQ1530440.1 YafY family transcriptional regulator [Lutispora saccharofermentans]